MGWVTSGEGWVPAHPQLSNWLPRRNKGHIGGCLPSLHRNPERKEGIVHTCAYITLLRPSLRPNQKSTLDWNFLGVLTEFGLQCHSIITISCIFKSLNTLKRAITFLRHNWRARFCCPQALTSKALSQLVPGYTEIPKSLTFFPSLLSSPPKIRVS